MKLKSVYIITLISFIFSEEIQSENKFRISRIHYSGGGDWYADPSSLPNLLDFLSKKTDIEVHNEENVVKIGDTNFNENNYYYLTGHGNVKLEQK